MYLLDIHHAQVSTTTAKKQSKKSGNKVKKIIILLMAVSIMLTSCGKLTGLLNGNKKADNKTPATNTNTSNQLQKIDNNIEQSWKGYAYDHMFAIFISVIVVAIAIGSIVWIVKNKNKSPQTTEPEKHPQPSKPPEASGQPQTTEPPELPKMIDIRHNLGSTDYETIFLSYPSDYLVRMINSGSSSIDASQKKYASAELEKRRFVPFSIPEGVDYGVLLSYSSYTNELLQRCFDRSSSSLLQQTINFIFECRKKND